MIDSTPLNVLLVEDDAGHAELIKWNFEKANINNPFFHVSNGQKAIDWIWCDGEYADNQDLPDIGNLIILLDINMPIMDGYEVLHHLRNHIRTQHVPVIIFTTTESKQEVRRGYLHGCNFYLKKPDSHLLFSATIQQLGILLQSLKTPSNLKHILYIEDDEGQIELFQRCMERKSYDFTIEYAHCGAEGLQLYSPDKHALVVIDYNLADMNGPEVVQLMQSKVPKTPFVFLSNAFTQDRLDEANALQVKRCITKGDIEHNLNEIAAMI
jgi:CheY-like chemotaxis protein